MDIPIKNKNRLKRKYILLVIGVLIICLLSYQALITTNVSTLNVDIERLSIEEVDEGVFYDYITVTGYVEPIATIFLDAREGGRVEEKVVEEGEVLKKGDIILRLSNPDLSLSILNSEAQLAEKSNFLRNTMVTMEQEKLQIKRELLNIEYNIKRKKRKYEHNKSFYANDLISRDEFLESEEEYQFASKSFELYVERQKQDSIYRSIQIKQMQDNLRNMDMNLKLVHDRQNNLNIVAPIDGQLTVLDAEVGQLIPKGGRIGQIHVLTSYKVVAQIDEHYIDKVKVGLTAILERQDQEYQLKIRKVLPDVRDGRFSIEMIFVGEMPENMRTGQTYYTRLQLGSPQKSMLLPRGNFFQKTGGQWIFVLSEDGKSAEKRFIKIGRQNPKFYELLEGINPGEKVILSGYDGFGDNEKLEW